MVHTPVKPSRLGVRTLAVLATTLCSSSLSQAATITSPADPVLDAAEAISMPLNGALPRFVATTSFGTLTYSGDFSNGFTSLGATSGGAPGEFLDISWDGGSALAIAFELVNINVAATLDVFDSADQLIESHPTPFGPGTNVQFFGVTAADIARVRITSNDSLAVRNILMTVPEPGTGTLVLLGLMGIGCRTSRRG